MVYSKEFRQEIATTQDLFVWEAPSWETYARGPKWYLWLGLVAFALVAYSIFTANYLFAFIILLMTIILVLAGNEAPHPVLIQIGHHGVVYDGQLYLFQELSDFAIVYQPPDIKLLYLQPKNFIKARMRIPLEAEDPVPIRAHLKRYVDEDLELRDEHLSDIIARLFRF